MSENPEPLIPERRFELLVMSVTDYAICMLDPEGRITTWNTGAERINGYTADEILGTHCSQFYLPEERESGAPERALRTAVEAGKYESEGWRVRKGGERFWASVVLDPIYESGRLVGLVEITRDVTERRRAAEALLESERRFRLLVQGVTDYAIFLLDLDGRVTNWNSGAQHIKGYTAEEIVGEHFSRFYTVEDRAAGKPAQALAEARQNGRFAADGWRVRKNGSRFWASVVLDAIRDETGELIGFAKVTRDITERLQMQQELEQAREQLFQMQKLEAIGDLTGGIAHDFNNLLTVIRGSIELAERHAAGNDRLTRLLRAAQAAAGRAADLTHQLLAFSRRQPLRPELISLPKQLLDTAGFLDRSLRGNIRTVIDVPADLSAVEVDPRQFELALLNVGLNARDAMPGGGTLRISARNVTIDDGPLGLKGDFVRIDITDEGVGIPAQLIDKVIEPFFTTKEVGKGSGLGLSQAYGFARQSGGTLAIESQVGRGTTVIFYLPARSGVALSRGPDATGQFAAEALGKGSVLVVEDDLAVAEFAVAALQDSGFNVTLVHCARAALERLEQGERFDVVFSDIIMPGKMNGVELAQAIRAQYPFVPVLLTTGFSDPAVSEEARRFPLITKPYQVQDLTARIAKLVDPGSRHH